MFKNNITTYLLFIMLVLLSSCNYSEYLTINISTHHGSQWDSTKGKIAFIASVKAYRKAEGISRFPDGGIPKYLKNSVAIYLFDPASLSLKKITSFNDLTGLIGASRSNWKTKIAFADTVLYYHVNPVSNWDFYKKQENKTLHNTIDSLTKKYNSFYIYHLHTGNITRTDSFNFIKNYKNSKEKNSISLTTLNKKLSEVPLSEWNLNVQKIYPKSNKQYIHETIYLENDCKTTRRAVVEQIISQLSAKEIHQLIDKMDKHKKKLSGIKKQSYEIHSNELYKKLNKLLQSKSNNGNH